MNSLNEIDDCKNLFNMNETPIISKCFQNLVLKLEKEI